MDRGPRGVEVMLLLLSLFAAFPRGRYSTYVVSLPYASYRILYTVNDIKRILHHYNESDKE